MAELIRCPECNSQKLYKDGLRYLSDGSSCQRWLCCGCGYRFSQPNIKVNVVSEVNKTLNPRDNNHQKRVVTCNRSVKEASNNLPFLPSEDVGSHTASNLTVVEKGLNTLPFYNSKHQVCALDKKAKNLDQATETKTVAGELEKLPEDAKGLIAKYMAYLEREGYYKDTSYLDLIKTLVKDGANLLNPEDVKTKIARHKWKDSVKMLATYAYDAFCKMEKIEWTKPKYKQQETIIDVPDEKDLDALISSTYSKKMTAFLQCLKETFADPGEILRLEWRDIKDNIITINHPVKGHLPGQVEVSSKLIALLNALPKKQKRIFPTTYKNMHRCLASLRKRAAQKLQNPNLLEISFKSFRHWGGSMLAQYTNGNVLTIKKMLRHKKIENTMKYIHTIQFKDEDFEIATATTTEEIKQLGQSGFVKYDEMRGIHFYRKPKRFGGLKVK